MKIAVKDIKGNSQGELEVKFPLVEGGKGTQAVHDVVVAYNAAQRMGTACTKNVGEVGVRRERAAHAPVRFNRLFGAVVASYLAPSLAISARKSGAKPSNWLCAKRFRNVFAPGTLCC
jgi:hypothetical protein